MIAQAFNDSRSTVRIEKPSLASKEANNKKRKRPLYQSAEKHQKPYIPDMTVLHGKKEYAILEASRTRQDIKQLVEGGRKGALSSCLGCLGIYCQAIQLNDVQSRFTAACDHSCNALALDCQAFMDTSNL